MDWVPTFRIFPFRCGCCDRISVGRLWQKTMPYDYIEWYPLVERVHGVAYKRRCFRCGIPTCAK